MTRRRGSSNSSEAHDCAASDTDEKFGFQSGPDFTLKQFQEYASAFKVQYFGIEDSSKTLVSCNDDPQKKWQPSVEEIEGEYWRIVEEPTEEVEVISSNLLWNKFLDIKMFKKYIYSPSITGTLRC